MIRFNQSKAIFVSAFFFFWLPGVAHAVEISVDTASIVPATVKAKLKGKIKGKLAFSDKLGAHILVLTRLGQVFPDGTEKVSIHASQFQFSGGTWKQEWIINDNLSCKDLDLEVDFIYELTTISDIDTNGMAESTVVYHLSCQGGIEPKPTKAILKQGIAKYAVRGESLIQIKGTAPYGGTFTADSTLDAKPAIKRFLVSIWKRAAGVEH